MANATLEREILGLEREYWDSMISKDPAVATRVTAPESIVVSAQGAGIVTPETIGPMVESGDWKLRSYDFKDVTFTSPSKDVAVVAYTVQGDYEIDGEPLRMEAHDASTWVKSGDGWKCALHTESVAGDAFGRDRQPALRM
jgi:hypothetical protein